MTGRGIICLAILIAAPASVLAQQAIQSLEPGQRVRLNGHIITSFVAVRSDSLIVSGSSIHLETLTRLEVGRARSVREGAVRGLAWGAAIGTGTALSLGLATMSEGSGILKSDPGDVVLGAAVMGAVGATLGLVIGSMTPGMTWSEIQPSALRTPTQESLRIRVQPTVAKGIGFSASIRTN